MTKLICPDCQHENEAERIYCHNCGARLDRSGIIKEQVAGEKDEEAARQRLKKMFDPNRGRASRVLKEFGKLILGSIVLAAIIVMLLPPELPPAPKDYSFAPMINMDLVSALSSRQPPSLTYSEEQVNSYLASLVRRKNGPAEQGYFPLERFFLQFREGQCAVHVVRRFFGLRVYSGSAYQVALNNGKIQASSLGGYIGRMPIAPPLMKYGDAILGKAWEVVAREKASVARLGGIQFHPQSVTLLVAR